MKKTFLSSLVLLLLLPTALPVNDLRGADQAPVTVSVRTFANDRCRGKLGPRYRIFRCTNRTTPTLTLPDLGPRYRIFRCTNRTGSPIPLVLTMTLNERVARVNHELRRKVVLPAGSVQEFTMLFPGGNYGWGEFSCGAESPAGVEVAVKDTVRSHFYPSVHAPAASPSFTPDQFEHLFPEETVRTNIPVREWPSDPDAYAGIPMIILDSEDLLSPAQERALLLAAARGTRLLVLVMGGNAWPRYAGAEKTGKSFTEKIGFGSRIVLRSRAVRQNPHWTKFVEKRQALFKKHGKGHRNYINCRWTEPELISQLRVIDRECFAPAVTDAGSVPAVPPIPLGWLTFLMVCFVIVIGPVNYFFLRKYRREMWSLATIPLLSLLFSGAVIVSVILKEGFDSSGRGRAETVLDQTTGLAASRGTFSIYSPMSLKKFRFDRADLLTFLEHGRVEGESKEEYTFSSALLPSRMRFSCGVERAEFRSEKLHVAEKEGRIEAVNGLGVPVNTLFLRGAGKELFKLAAPLEPGARAELRPVPPSAAGMKLPRLAENSYLAEVSAPLFIGPGLVPDKYEHHQSVRGRWR